MAGRPGTRGRTPGPLWAVVADHVTAPDEAGATDGRHALDRDAALTPIFTALRRGRWRRPRVQPSAHRDGPPTAPIPIVRALRAVDPYSPASFARTPPPPRPSPVEATTVWPRAGDPTGYSPIHPPVCSPVTDTGRHHRRLAPAGW